MCEWSGSRTKHPIPFFAIRDNTIHKDLLTQTKKNMLFLSLGQNIFRGGRNGMGCIVRDGKKWHRMFCPGWQILAGCFVWGVKKRQGMFCPGMFCPTFQWTFSPSFGIHMHLPVTRFCPSFGTYCIGEQLIWKSPTQFENRIMARVYARALHLVLCTKKLNFVSRNKRMDDKFCSMWVQLY